MQSKRRDREAYFFKLCIINLLQQHRTKMAHTIIGFKFRMSLLDSLAKRFEIYAFCKYLINQ